MLKVEYRDHIGFENKRLENEIHSRMTAYRAAMGGEELTMMQSWIIRILYEHSYKQFIETDNIRFGGNNSEIYFEVDDFDEFAEKIKKLEIEYVHPVKEHGWGQRVVRFYDPDKHIVEVGENMQFVCKRFKAEGMTPGQIAKRMDVPTEYVNNLLKQKE